MAPHNKSEGQPAGRNRSIRLDEEEVRQLSGQCLRLGGPATPQHLQDRVINQDIFQVLPCLPSGFVDLLFIDPPYNQRKDFNGAVFRERSGEQYELWLESWLAPLLHILKPQASVYICGDWRSSGALQRVAEKYLHIRNRITWEREKGRGALANWKNCSEDIWFCTVGEQYTFNVEAVKLRRRVIAPYKDARGKPKDWNDSEEGRSRLTHPSNLWTDLTVPFWSMPENTEHPTQKPEKLLAKIILASSQPGDMVFDPFLGSGTSAVSARKLGRYFCGVEFNARYCALALKRLALAEQDKGIQGYHNGVFEERNFRKSAAGNAGTDSTGSADGA